MSAQTQQTGLAKITSLLAAATFWLQWGTGTGAGSSATTVTTTSTTEARSSATLTQQTTTSTNDTFQLVATITEASTGPVAITEVGAFDSAGTGSPPTGGNMDFYASFSAINVSLGDSIAFTMKVKFT